jgi:hypothetical protein
MGSSSSISIHARAIAIDQSVYLLQIHSLFYCNYEWKILAVHLLISRARFVALDIQKSLYHGIHLQFLLLSNLSSRPAFGFYQDERMGAQCIVFGRSVSR